MNINAIVSIKIRNFLKKNGRFILIAFVVWLIIFIINQYLKRLPEENALTNTYLPNIPIIDDGGNIPNAYISAINTTIDDYINYCNNKDYENAFNMLTNQCKEYLYGNDLQLFKEYVDSIFTSKKIYNLQNYSNVNGVYIYDIVILDDIEASGTSNGYEQYKDKIALRRVGEKFQISNQSYIESINYNIIAEDENIKVNIKSKDVSYRREGYNVTIVNKTDKYVVILDNTIKDEITLNLEDQKRKTINFSNASLVLNPGETREEVFIFDKFYDNQKNPTEISLENVRILNNYTSIMENTAELADRMYSFNIALNK